MYSMNLTKILKQFDRIRQQQKDINKKYSPKSTNMSKSRECQQEDDEDRKIYGCNNKDMLQMFKKKQHKFNLSEHKVQNKIKLSLDNTANHQRKNNLSQSFDFQDQKFEIMNTKNRKIQKTVHHKQKAYILSSKNDIFNSKMKILQEKGSQFNAYSMDASNIISKNLKKQSVKRGGQYVSQKYKNEFLQTFKENFDKFQSNNLQDTHIYEHTPAKFQNHIFSVTQNRKVGTKQKMRTIFHLTDLRISEKCSNTTENQLKQNIDVLKLSAFLLPLESQNIQNVKNMKKITNYNNKLFLDDLTNNFSILLLSTQSLANVIIDCQKRDGIVYKVGKNEQVNIFEIVQQNLKLCQQFLHFGIFDMDGRLFYEQFIINGLIRSSQTKQNELQFLLYYLKRFLLFDPTIKTVKSAIQDTNLIFKNRLPIPDSFMDYIASISRKTTYFSDKYYNFTLINVQDKILGAIETLQQMKKDFQIKTQGVILKDHIKCNPNQSIYEEQCFYI